MLLGIDVLLTAAVCAALLTGADALCLLCSSEVAEGAELSASHIDDRLPPTIEGNDDVIEGNCDASSEASTEGSCSSIFITSSFESELPRGW